MMTIDLAEIERKARAATPGPWKADWVHEGWTLEDRFGSAVESAEDFAHIAANDPAAVLAWVEETRRLRDFEQSTLRDDIESFRQVRRDLDSARATIAEQAAEIERLESVAGGLRHSRELGRSRIRKLESDCRQLTDEIERLMAVHDRILAITNEAKVGCVGGLVDAVQCLADRTATRDRYREALEEIASQIPNVQNDGSTDLDGWRMRDKARTVLEWTGDQEED